MSGTGSTTGTPSRRRRTRRARRETLAGAPLGPQPGDLTWRPPRRDTVGLGVVVIALPVLLLLGPGRGSSPDPQRVAPLVAVFWALTGTLIVRYGTRTHVSLRRPATGPLVLVVRGPLRGRAVDLSGVRTARVIFLRTGRVPSPRALLLAADGTAVTSAVAPRDYWVRPEVRALLRDAGIATEFRSASLRPREVEAAYPGTTTWVERHPRLLAFVLVVPVLVVVGGIAEWLGL